MHYRFQLKFYDILTLKKQILIYTYKTVQLATLPLLMLGNNLKSKKENIL